eukprot:6347748-Prorocentrum_lima.AAC.1
MSNEQHAIDAVRHRTFAAVMLDSFLTHARAHARYWKQCAQCKMQRVRNARLNTQSSAHRT